MAVWVRVQRLLPSLWLGGLLALACVAAPSIMSQVGSPQAGQAVGRMLSLEAHVSLALAVMALLVQRRHRMARAQDTAREAAAIPALSGEALLVLGAAFCMLAGHFGLQPLMAEAREGRGALSFGALHALSVVFFGVKTLLVGVWAWSTTSPRASWS